MKERLGLSGWAPQCCWADEFRENNARLGQEQPQGHDLKGDPVSVQAFGFHIQNLKQV